MLGQLKNEKDRIYKLVIIFLGFIVAFCVVWSVRNIALATHDDIGSYMNVRLSSLGQYSSEMIAGMPVRGRFSPIQLLAYIIYYLVIKSGSQFLYILMMYLPIAANTVFLAYIVGKQFNKWAAMTIPVLFFALVQIDNNHNLFLSYPFVFQAGFAMFLLGLHLFFKYKDNPKERYLWLSALCMFDSFSAYESFVTYFAVFFLLAFILNCRFEEKRFRFQFISFMKMIKYHLIAAVIFVGLYIFFRMRSNVDYGGAVIDTATFSFRLAIKTILKFSFSLFPLREFFGAGGFSAMNLSAIGIRTIVKAVAAAAAVGMILFKSEKLNGKKLLVTIFISLVACVIFCLPHAMTPQYQAWVSIGVSGFVPSFFSYFWIIVAFGALIVYLCNLSKMLKPFLIGLFSIVMFFGSVATDMSNLPTLSEKQNTTVRYKMFDRLAASDYYSDIEEGAAIYVEGYSGIHNKIGSLGQYGKIYCDKNFVYTNEFSDVLKYENRYRIWYDYEGQVIYMAKINEYGLGDEVYVVSYTNDYHYFNTKKSPEENPVYINGNNMGRFGYSVAVPVNATQEGIMITGEDLILSSCRLTSAEPAMDDHLNAFGEIVTPVQFGESVHLLNGWYENEDWGTWSQAGKCAVLFVLPKMPNEDVKVDMDVSVLTQPQGLDVEISCDGQKLCDKNIKEPGNISFVIPASCIKSRLVSIQFDVKNAVSPSQLGLSIDARILGLGVMSFEFNAQ